MDEPLLEADVLGVAQAAVGLQRGRVVGADVEDDVVARLQQLRCDGAGHSGGEAAAAMVGLGEDVADDRQPRLARDDVRPGRRDELATGAHPEIHALGDGRRRQP